MGPGLFGLQANTGLCLSLGQAGGQLVLHMKAAQLLAASLLRQRADQVREMSPSSGVKQGRLGYDELLGPSSPLPLH